MNEEYPTSQLRVTVPQAGPHSYTAKATAVFDFQGNRLEYTGAGQGILRVRGGIDPYYAKLHDANDRRCIFRHSTLLVRP